MPSLRVDCLNDIQGLAGYLETRFETNVQNQFKLMVSQDEDYLTVTFDRNIKGNARRYSGEIDHLSDILAEYILKYHEKSILEKVINQTSKGLLKKDKDEVYRIAYGRLYAHPESNLGSLVETRRRLISTKISEYLQSANKITIEGFVTFRLGDYVKHLQVEVERAVRQFLIEKQYEEYINLLTTYVRMQVPRVPELHVFAQRHGGYKVEGAKPFEIPRDIIETFGVSANNPVIENDDFMIGFLLTCAPVRVYIHNIALFKNKELLSTIRIIFTECILLDE